MNRYLRTAVLTVLIGLSVLFTGNITASALTVVPDSATRIGSHWYKIYSDVPTDSSPKGKALELCKQRGGHIAYIEDASEHQLVLNMIANSGINGDVCLEFEPMYAELNDLTIKYDDKDRAFSNYDIKTMGEYFIYVCEWDEGNKSSEFKTDFGKKLIPDKTKSFGSSQYKVFGYGLSYSDAALFCHAIGGHLVSIDSEEENKFVTKLIKDDDSSRSMFWIGTRYDGSIGKWCAPDGTPSDYTDWSSGEPTNYLNGANFTVINRSVGLFDKYKWVAEFNDGFVGSDLKESSACYGFVCEWEPVCGGERYFHGSTERTATERPNCITEGKISVVCKDCGETIEVIHIPKDPHKYRITGVVKNIKVVGLTVRECSVCGDRTFDIDWKKIWFEPLILLAAAVTSAAFISAYADYRREHGSGAPPMWALLLAFAMIAAAALTAYLIFIK